MAVTRAVKESPITQGADEIIAYTLTTTPWGASPTSISVKLYEGASKTDRSATMLSGIAGATGDVITTPLVTGLTAGQVYRLEIKFTSSGNVFEAFCIIYAEA